MKFFKKTIDFLNRLKDKWKEDDYEGISDYERELIEEIPTQNPYGLIGMVMGSFIHIRLRICNHPHIHNYFLYSNLLYF